MLLWLHVNFVENNQATKYAGSNINSKEDIKFSIPSNVIQQIISHFFVLEYLKERGIVRFSIE